MSEDQYFHFGDGYTLNKKEMVGSGTNGKVFSCNSTKIQGPLVVKVSTNKLHQVIPLSQYEHREKEILEKLMKKSQKENCLHLVRMYTQEILHELNVYCIVMERCEQTLGDILFQRYGKQRYIKGKPQAGKGENSPQAALDINWGLNIFIQILNGYKYFYKQDIIHRDIKPENILYKQGLYKISDFGEAKIVTKECKNMTRGRGTPAFQSPQMASFSIEENEESRQITSKADIYSLGILFFELLTGELPYEEPNVQISIPLIREFFKRIRSEPFRVPNKYYMIPKDLVELIEKMLQYHEKDRIGWEELFAHERFNIKLKPKVRPSDIRWAQEPTNYQNNQSPLNAQTPKTQPPSLCIQPNNIPKPNIQPNNIPQLNIQPKNIPKPNIQQNNIPQPNIQPNNIPQPNIQPNNIPQNIPQTKIQPDMQPASNLQKSFTDTNNLQRNQNPQTQTIGQCVNQNAQQKEIKLIPNTSLILYQLNSVQGGVDQALQDIVATKKKQCNGLAQSQTDGQKTVFQPRPINANSRLISLEQLKEFLCLFEQKCNEMRLKKPNDVKFDEMKNPQQLMQELTSILNKYPSHFNVEQGISYSEDFIKVSKIAQMIRNNQIDTQNFQFVNNN